MAEHEAEHEAEAGTGAEVEPRAFEPVVGAPPTAATDEIERIATAQLLEIHRASLRPAPEEVVEAQHISESYAVISAAIGVVGLLGCLFVLWMVPFSIGAVVFAMLARKAGKIDRWYRLGLVTGITGIVFGGVWLVYYLGLLAI